MTTETKKEEETYKIPETKEEALKIIDDVITREVNWAYDPTDDIEEAWAILQEHLRQGGKNSLAKKIAFQILLKDWGDLIYEPPYTDEGQNRDPKNPYSGLTLDAENRLNELHDIIASVLKQ